MQGELKVCNGAVPVGETHNVDCNIFKNSNDTNVQLLVKLIEQTDETYNNINNIQIDE